MSDCNGKKQSGFLPVSAYPVSVLYYLHRTLLTALVAKCVEAFPPQQVILHDTSWVSYSWTPCWHYLLGDSDRSHKLGAESHKTAITQFRCQSQVGPQFTHNFRPVGYKLEVSMTPILAQLVC